MNETEVTFLSQAPNTGAQPNLHTFNSLSPQIVDLKQLGISTERPQKKLPTGPRTVAFICGLYEYKSTSCNRNKLNFSVFQHFHNFLVYQFKARCRIQSCIAK